MTPARVVTCSALPSRAKNPRASSSPGDANTLWLTTTMVSMVWADRRTGGPADKSVNATPTASPPDRLSAALLDCVNALTERIGHVPRAVVPLRKVQRRVHSARELAQPARCQAERAADRVRLERAAQARHRRERGDPRRRRPQRVGRIRRQLAHATQLQAYGQRVLVAFAVGGVEVVAREHDVSAPSGRVDPEPHDGELRVDLSV